MAKARKDLALVNAVKGLQGLKKKDFQKLKLTPPGIRFRTYTKI